MLYDFFPYLEQFEQVQHLPLYGGYFQLTSLEKIYRQKKEMRMPHNITKKQRRQKFIYDDMKTKFIQELATGK